MRNCPDTLRLESFFPLMAEDLNLQQKQIFEKIYLLNDFPWQDQLSILKFGKFTTSGLIQI